MLKTILNYIDRAYRHPIFLLVLLLLTVLDVLFLIFGHEKLKDLLSVAIDVLIFYTHPNRDAFFKELGDHIKTLMEYVTK